MVIIMMGYMPGKGPEWIPPDEKPEETPDQERERREKENIFEYILNNQEVGEEELAEAFENITQAEIRKYLAELEVAGEIKRVKSVNGDIYYIPIIRPDSDIKSE